MHHVEQEILQYCGNASLHHLSVVTVHKTYYIVKFEVLTVASWKKTDCLLGCSTVSCGRGLPMFLRCLLPLSLGLWWLIHHLMIRKQAPLKHQQPSTRQHGATSRKIVIFTYYSVLTRMKWGRGQKLSYMEGERVDRRIILTVQCYRYVMFPEGNCGVQYVQNCSPCTQL